MRQRRLNIPLPPLRPHGERHLSPFYRPAPHTNDYSNPDVDYDELRAEARNKREPNREYTVGMLRRNLAYLKRVVRRMKRQGRDLSTLTLDDLNLA